MVALLSLVMAINALALDPDSHRELVELEFQTVGHDPEFRACELARCFNSDRINDPNEGFLYWAGRHWYLQDKRGKWILLRPNVFQGKYLAGRSDKNVVLKDRKRGMSTLIDALYYWRARRWEGQKLYVLADDDSNKDKLYQNVLEAHRRMVTLRPWITGSTRRSNRKELQFADNGSILRFLTAGGGGGRSGDADGVHCSEWGFYQRHREVTASFLESLRYGAWVDKESTPQPGHFRDDYYDAKNGRVDYTAFFFPWHGDPENSLPLDPGETITPTEAERGLVEANALTPEQIKWRRAKVAVLKTDFHQEHPEDDVRCFQRIENPKFDSSLLAELLMVVEDRVESVRPQIGEDSGRFTCWVPPRPGHRYVIGADVAEGIPGRAYSAAGVLDLGPPDGPVYQPEQVAEWWGHVSPGDFAAVLARIGNWYGGDDPALVAVERNNHGHATLRALQMEQAYEAIYHHVEYNQRTGRTAKPGWPTNAVTKPRMFTDLRECIDHGHMIVRSAEFVRECMNFQVGDEDRDDADEKHVRYVDRVFAWAIAWQVRGAGQIAVA